jgi:hypothetical protein
MGVSMLLRGFGRRCGLLGWPEPALAPWDLHQGAKALPPSLVRNSGARSDVDGPDEAFVIVSAELNLDDDTEHGIIAPKLDDQEGAIFRGLDLCQVRRTEVVVALTTALHPWSARLVAWIPLSGPSGMWVLCCSTGRSGR